MRLIQKSVFLICFLGVSVCVQGQDSLSLEMLQPISYHFLVTDGQLTGKGADFLKKEIAKAQFTLLGDYPDSKSSSDFSAALLPELNRFEYKTMALGIGVPSARLLNAMVKESQSVVPELKALNNTYGFTEKEMLVLPMPDMKSVADARFVQKAGELKWSIVGFGNESWNNLPWLLDQLYEGLSEESQKINHSLYLESKTFLKVWYAKRNGDLLAFATAVENSKFIYDFLKIAGEKSPENLVIVEAFNNSIKNCRFYAEKEFFDKNEWRVDEEKRLLRQELEQINFDIHQDKLFVKWDMNFLSRGFQPYAFYGVGNTLSEIANYNGSKSLHIGIVPRFQSKNGVIQDLMKLENTMAYRFAALTQAAKKNQWTVIDLQQMIQETHYTPVKYLLDAPIQDLIKRYDLIIIPAVEKEATLNYDK
ncbi:hypothetical protein FEE95_05005 [Maribacter algarum]|uniref:Uncharacterized protein n=1 Tax=Maribacter algarum (ex Zhang et al. 2020) TaxID=2578118 RepID=A0A5S3PUV6_9FLAO|nr:hypothetical protein [Maribacter algarum]TMM58791.1 hypothetical protein FEE95_05005 [Maribacter algarum]